MAITVQGAAPSTRVSPLADASAVAFVTGHEDPEKEDSALDYEALAEALQMHESGIEDYLLVRQTLGDWRHIAHTSLSRFSARLTFRTSGSTGVRAEMTYHKLREKGYNVAFVKGDIEIDKAGNLKIVPN